MSPPLDSMTEVLQADVARFPRAKLVVLKGPDKGNTVVLEGQTVVVGTDESCQLRLTDTSVSRRHLELSGGPGGYRLRDLRSTNGVHVSGLQVLDARLSEKLRFTIGRTELRFEPERHEIQWPLSPSDHFGDVLGKSVVMRRIFAILERAAQTASGVVLEGEPGSGREALARALHDQSNRKEGPFVVVEVDAASEPLIDSDLFGYDASHSRPMARPGAFEEAEHGTLYLDEVCDLSAPLQARVLRALETEEVRRPHGDPVKIEVRVIASTQKDLEAEVRAGRFREDLYFKLAVFKVRVPPLRERMEDVPMLVRHFAAKARSQPLNPDTLDMLARHDWPGNVRELRHVLERLAAFPDLGAASIARALGKHVDASGSDESSGARLRAEVSNALLALPYHEAKERVLESFEKTYLSEHLKNANGVVTRAAQRSGLPRQSFHRMLRRLGINSSEE